MKNLKKRMVARQGFTLVELIVVIAILAILAAVAYPVYTGYIEKAKDASALQQFGSILTAVQGTAAKTGQQVGTISVTIDKSSGKINSITAKDTSKTDIPLDKNSGFLLLLAGSDVNNVGAANLTVDKDSSYAKASGAHWTPPSGNTGGWETGTAAADEE